MEVFMKTIYTNGYILTLNDIQPEALVEENGIIVGLGDYHNLYEENMNVVDLKGCTLMPSFIDSHGHLSGYAMSLLQVALEDCQSIKDIQMTIQQYMQEHEGFIVCKGYNEKQLQEQRHITKQELDEISDNRPIVIQHYTGHCGILNSVALKYLNIDQTTQAPQGGQIDFEQGFLEENAYTSYIQKIPMASLDELKKAYHQAQIKYASYGITTVQDGMVVDELKDIYLSLVESKNFFLDIVVYPGFDAKAFLSAFEDYQQQYHYHLKVGGYKMFLDGSPQNKTAWTIDPYTDGTYGYSTLTDEQIKNNLIKAIRENMQVIAHCNGDQAIQHYIEQYQLVHQQDIRPVIIHAQMMRASQMEQAKTLKMIPSFFLAHVYYFGHIHQQNMGYQRAQTISPLNSALKHHLLFTLHQDAPVIEPNMLETIQIAVLREMKNHEILGKEERISVLDAIKAVTIHAGYQYFEENEKGTLDIGKKADMIILSENPLTANHHHIKDIQILQTIKEGQIVYIQGE